MGRRPGRYQQTVRVLRMLDYLRTAGMRVPLARLAELFEVSERQVRRDLDAISASGVPVLIDYGHVKLARSARKEAA